MIKKIISHPLVMFFFLYLLSYGLILINAGVYWDDWCIYNMSDEGISEAFIGNGGFYLIPIHSFLQNISNSPPILYHVLTFILYFTNTVFLYHTLPYLKVKNDNRFILTALFTVIPINFARIYMICFPYTLGIFFCFAAIYCFTVAFYKKQLLLRIISLLCCIPSFIFLPSTFVFIPAYIAFLIALNNINSKISITKNIKEIVLKSLKYIDFIIITITTWTWLLIFAKPTELYAANNYNTISLKHIALSPLNLLRTFIESFCGLINYTNYRWIFVIVLILLFFILCKKSIFNSIPTSIFNFLYKDKTVKIPMFASLGLYFLIAGALAYVFVGKIPIFIGPNSRLQILLGIGISLILLDCLLHLKYRKYVFIVLLSLFVSFNITQCVIFQRAYYKQLAIVMEMKKQEKIIDNKNFILIDNTQSYDESQLGIAFYALHGIVKKTFADETRFIVSRKQYNHILLYGNVNTFKKSMYNMKNISFNNHFDYYIIIDHGYLNMEMKNVFRLMIEEYFYKQKFNLHINKLLTVNCIPYKND
jgi:hypothetical protein